MNQKDIPFIDMGFDPLNEEVKFENILKIKEVCLSISQNVTSFFSNLIWIQNGCVNSLEQMG